MRGIRLWRFVLALASISLLVNCAPPQTSSGGPTEGTAPAGPKTLRMAMQSEPKPGVALFDDSQGPGRDFNVLTFHSGLTFFDSDGNPQPLLAQKIPSLSDGDWKTLPDGKMEVTWKLRPNVKWHDGHAFSSDDVMLGMRMVLDKDVGIAPAAWIPLISDFSAPDPLTFVLTWKEPYFLADRAHPRELPVVATHIVGQLYEDGVKSGNRQAFLNSPYWATDWIGLGPFKPGERVLGSSLVATAFDDYFLGRPKLDRLSIRYITDQNAIISAVLAGEIDFVPVGSFSIVHVNTLKQQWETTGAGTATPYPYGLGVNYFQFGDPEAPWAKDLRVRQAIAHMYDRQTYVDTLQYGLTTVADTVVSPSDPIYKLVQQRGLTHRAYDLTEAARLMGQAGWNRGSDGVYKNAAGAPFDIEVITKQVSDDSLRLTQASAAMLKAGGLNSSFHTFGATVSTTEDRHERSIFKGLFASLTINDEPRAGQGFLTSGIRLDDAGNSVGTNTYRYSNPSFDQLFSKYITTLDPGPRAGLRADVLKVIADDLPAVPLFYAFLIVSQTIRKNVHGPGWVHPAQAASGWDIQKWNVD